MLNLDELESEMRYQLYAALSILGVCAATPAAFAQTPLAAPVLTQPLAVKVPTAVEQIAAKPVAALVANADIKSRLLSGRVDQSSQIFLSDEQQEQGFVLLCQARPLSDVTVRMCTDDEIDPL